MVAWTRWRDTLRQPAAAYALAVALSAVAFALRPGLGPRLGADPVLVLALPVVVVSAWAGGFGPGLLATLLMMAGRLAWALSEAADPLDSTYFLRSAIALPSALMVCAAFEQVRRARLRAEQRAAAAEDDALAAGHLAAALQALPISVFDMDLELRYVRQLHSAMGLPEEQMIGKRAEDLFDAATAEQLTRLRREVIASGQPRRAEVAFDGPRGRFCMDLFVTPLRDEQGRIIGVTNVAVDITEKKQRETAEQRAQQRLQSLVDSSAVAIAFSRGGVITEANDAFLLLMGHTREDLQAGRIHQGSLVPEFERSVYAMAKQELDETGRNGPFRAVLKRPDGILVDVITSAGKLGDNDYCIFFTDITALSRAEQALRVSEERLRSLVENTPLAVVEFDGSLRITRWAGQAEAMFGWSAQEALGQGAAELGWALPEEELGPARLRELLRGEASRVRFRIRNARKDGRILHAEWSISAMWRPGQSRPAALLALVLDVTEAEQAVEQLRQADRQKDGFIATLAHELRNPLAPIANGARLLALKAGDPKTVTWSAQAIERQVRQLTRLLDDLLDVSRISRNILHLQRQRMRLQEAIELAAEQVRPFIEAQGHRLELQVSARPMPLMGDLARLTQVFANLLHNAAKYTPEPGLITLQAEPRGEWLVVAVQDPGLGIPPGEQQRVFEMFSQAHPELRGAHPGLGIGLALVKGIVEIHGGTVRVESEGPGRGSRFTVELPALQAAEEQAAAAPGDPLAALTGYRVLVVDDNVDSAESIAALLGQLGNTVRTAFGAQAALALGPEFHPAVVLMDIGMPGIDGLQAARMMRETVWGRAAVLVAMTGYGQPDDKRRAMQAGFDHHFTKPVDLEALARCLTG
jgi:PAS domain S-box-containing protein